MRFSLNITNGLGDAIVNEAEATGRSKQRMICHMAETYFENKNSNKIGETTSLNLFLLSWAYPSAFIIGGLGLNSTLLIYLGIFSLTIPFIILKVLGKNNKRSNIQPKEGVKNHSESTR